MGVEELFDTLLQGALETHLVLQLAGCHAGHVLVGSGLVENLAPAVRHGDVFGIHALHAGGEKVDNGLHLLGGQGLAILELEHDGRRRWGLFFDKKALAGKNQVYTCGFHFGQLGDGPGQFSLQGALVVDVLDEIGLPDLVFVKELEAHSWPCSVPAPASLSRAS